MAEAELDSCQCQGLERETKKWALEDLALYRKGKPVNTTPMLIRALADAGVSGLTLLDIGGGIGAVQLQLLGQGVSTATSVEASSAYIEVAREEAARADLDRRISYLHGDFVTLAKEVPDADIVTLDRVICCYDDVEALVSLSAAKARKLYGLVYPRATWWAKMALFFENWVYRLRGSAFRAFVHPTEVIDRLVRKSGLKEVHRQETFAWQVVVYQR
jgi:magnesium-protoporphyrin O-methyltransferase